MLYLGAQVFFIKLSVAMLLCSVNLSVHPGCIALTVVNPSSGQLPGKQVLFRYSGAMQNLTSEQCQKMQLLLVLLAANIMQVYNMYPTVHSTFCQVLHHPDQIPNLVIDLSLKFFLHFLLYKFPVQNFHLLLLCVKYPVFIYMMYNLISLQHIHEFLNFQALWNNSAVLPNSTLQLWHCS